MAGVWSGVCQSTNCGLHPIDTQSTPRFKTSEEGRGNAREFLVDMHCTFSQKSPEVATSQNPGALLYGLDVQLAHGLYEAKECHGMGLKQPMATRFLQFPSPLFIFSTSSVKSQSLHDKPDRPGQFGGRAECFRPRLSLQQWTLSAESKGVAGVAIGRRK